MLNREMHSRNSARMRLRLLSLASVVGLVLLLSLLISAPAAALPTGYQEYYVLGYEEHVWRAFRSIYEGPDEDVPGRICSTVSLVATADYQVIYYDHWEDGYEADLLNPVQSTTEIYGDGKLSNGGMGSDILLAGDDINLTSDQEITGPMAINGYVPVDPARSSADLRYDGGDRVISSGGPVDLTHAMWPLYKSWIGGAWEVYSRQAHADAYSYRLPIGEDLYDFSGGDEGPYGDFRNVYLQLGAFENNTTVLIDNGSDVVDLTLNRGWTYSSMGYINSTSAPSITINSGTTIRSDEPVQVGLVTGADSIEGDGFQGRFLIVLSDLLWGADYVVPVPSGGDGDQAEIYLSNPNDFPITVNAYDAVMQTAFVIDPSSEINSTVPYSRKRGGLGYVPQDSAVRFTSSDGVFGVVVAADTSDVQYDWGFSGIPAKFLTRDYYVSWAPGNFCTPPDDPECDGDALTPGLQPALNGSPVWVTPLADGTTFYVDFSPLDGIVDETFTLDVLQQRRIFDPDNDNTATHVWATGEFAIAWGEDPRTAKTESPYLDLGFATLPLLQRWLDPVLTLDKTASPTILPSAGGTVTFKLVAQGYNAPLDNVDITDTLPINWTYVPGSTRVTYPNGGSGSPEPTSDGQTLFWDLSTYLDPNQALTLTFQAQITQTGGVDVTAYDGFESGTYAGGANWASDWQEGGDDGNPGGGDVRIVTSGSPFVGSRHLRIQAANNSISRTVNLDDFVLPTLRFMRRVDQLESGDYFYLDVHDGINWTPVLTWTDGDMEGSYVQEIVDLAPYASAFTLIRFRSGSTVGSGDYFYADRVEVYDGIAVSVNRGEAVGRDEYSNTLFSPSDEATVYISSLSLTKSVSSAQAEIGDTLVYTLSYANLNPSIAATNVTLRDAVPIQYVTFQSASDGGVYDAASGAIIWTLGTLPPGASDSVIFTVRVNNYVEDGTILENVGHIDSDQAQAGSNLVRTTVLAPDVRFYKSGPTAAARGQVITYTLSYRNVGKSEATGVVISDTMPLYTAYLPGSLAINTGSGWVTLSDAVDGDQGAYISPTLMIAPGASPGAIGAGEAGQIRFSVQIAEDLSNSVILNSATLDRNLDIPRDSNTVVTRISDLLLSKTAEKTAVAPGGVVSYTLTYENASEAVAHTNVYVREPIPSYTSFIAGSAYGGDRIEYSWDNGATWSVMLPIRPVTHIRWYDAELPNGAESVGFAVRVNATLPRNTTIRNIAHITSTESAAYTEEWIPSNQVALETVDLWLKKRVSQPTALAGDLISYTISYGNHGSADASGVQILDTLPADTTYSAGSIWGTGADDREAPLLVWDVMTVTAGASAREVGYAVVLDSDLLPGAVVTNSAAISSTYGAVASGPVTVVIALAPDITVSPAALTATLNVGATAIRALTVGNMGAADLTWSLLESPDVPWLDEAPTGGTVAPLDSEEVMVTFDATGLMAGVYTTILQVSSDDPDEPQVNVPVTLVVGVPLLSLDKEASSDPVAPGERLTYTLHIANSGLTAQGLVVSDVVPAETTFVSCGGADCGLVGDTVVWGPLDLTGAGTALDLTLVVTVSESLTNGQTITNAHYQLVAENAPLLSGPPVTTTVSEAILSLSKWAFRDEVFAGSRLDYALLVRNTGGRARHLVVSDTLPAHTEFGGCDCAVTGSAAALTLSREGNGTCGVPFTCSLEGDRIVWRLEEMAGGRSLQMNFWVTVDDGLSDSALIVNDSYAVVADHLPPLIGSPPVTTTVRELNVSVSKMAWPDPVMVSQSLVFTITVRNDGSLLQNVLVTDLLPSGVSFVSCGGALCELGGGAEPEVKWWLPTLPTDSERELTVRVSVVSVPSGMLVNEFYGAWIPAAGRRVVGAPVKVRVLYFLYLPILGLNHSP